MAKRKAKAKPRPRAKADKALAARRVEDILRIRLDGAEWWDVVQFVRENQSEQGSAWFLAEGEKPLSEAMIRKYQERADKLVIESHEKSRKKLLRRHLAQRRNLYARAVTTGELATALRCLDSEALLLGLHTQRLARPVAGPEKDRKARLAESVAFYEAIVARIDLPLGDRMKAQERIDKLLGLECIDIEERLDELQARLEDLAKETATNAREDGVSASGSA
jgi:hypothetical protein